MKKATLDMVDRIEELREKVSEIEEQQGELIDELEAKYGEDEDVPEAAETLFEEYEGRRIEAMGKRNRMARAIIEWGDRIPHSDIEEWEGFESWETFEDWEDLHQYGDTEFTITELSTGGLGRVIDQSQSGRADSDQDLPGARLSAALQVAVVDAPSGAPDDPRDYPRIIGEWLFDRVNALNTVGDTELGNRSLQEEMRKRRER